MVKLQKGLQPIVINKVIKRIVEGIFRRLRHTISSPHKGMMKLINNNKEVTEIRKKTHTS